MRGVRPRLYLITIFFTFFVVFYEKIPDDGRVGIIILCVFVQWAARRGNQIRPGASAGIPLPDCA